MRTYFNILVSWRLRTVLLGVCACLCGAMLNTKAGRFQQTAHFLLWVSKAPEQLQLVLVQQRYNSEPHKGSDVYLVPGISYSNENRLLWRMTRWIIFKKYYFKKIEKPYPGRLRRISGGEKKKIVHLVYETREKNQSYLSRTAWTLDYRMGWQAWTSLDMEVPSGMWCPALNQMSFSRLRAANNSTINVIVPEHSSTYVVCILLLL